MQTIQLLSTNEKKPCAEPENRAGTATAGGQADRTPTPTRRPRKPRLSREETRAIEAEANSFAKAWEAVDQGELGEFMRFMGEHLDAPPFINGWAEVAQRIRRCIRQASKRGTEAVAEGLLTEMLQTLGELYLRASLKVGAMMAERDRQGPAPIFGSALLSAEVTDVWLPRLSRIGGEIKDVTRLLVALRGKGRVAQSTEQEAATPGHESTAAADIPVQQENTAA